MKNKILAISVLKKLPAKECLIFNDGTAMGWIKTDNYRDEIRQMVAESGTLTPEELRKVDRTIESSIPHSVDRFNPINVDLAHWNPFFGPEVINTMVYNLFIDLNAVYQILKHHENSNAILVSVVLDYLLALVSYGDREENDEAPLMVCIEAVEGSHILVPRIEKPYFGVAGITPEELWLEEYFLPFLTDDTLYDPGQCARYIWFNQSLNGMEDRLEGTDVMIANSGVDFVTVIFFEINNCFVG